MEYDYTGSNAFFGAEGTPVAIENAGPSAVESAQDVRAYMRYKF
jgi:hypothetical protein